MPSIKSLPLLLLSLSLLLLNSCKTNKESFEIDGIQINIPKIYQQLKPNKEQNKILKLRYKDELVIVVGYNTVEYNQESLFDDFTQLGYQVKANYDLAKKHYQGYDQSDLDRKEINGHLYIGRRFKCMEDGIERYYEFAMYNVQKKYFELLITGITKEEEKHRPLIHDFLKGFVKK